MEEFGLNDFGGTSINSLKNNDIDIDFDNILNNLKMSESENDDKKKTLSNKLSSCSSGLCGRQSNTINMKDFAKKINNNIDKMYDNNLEPMPINYDKNMEEKDKLNNVLPKEIIDDVNNKNDNKEHFTNTLDSYYKYIQKNYFNIFTQDIIIYTLLFLILNNNFVIKILYNPITIRYDRYNLNLLIRTILFFVCLYLIKNKLLYNNK